MLPFIPNLFSRAYGWYYIFFRIKQKEISIFFHEFLLWSVHIYLRKDSCYGTVKRLIKIILRRRLKPITVVVLGDFAENHGRDGESLGRQR